MAKTVKIPDNMRPWEVTINGIKYVYPAGTTQEVPDEVAALIERISNVQPEKEPNMPPFAGGAQADMNAAEGEPGHVLNRTHWVERGMVEILPETTLTEGNATEVVAAIPPLGFVVGDNYIVKVNGVEYACVAGAYEDEGVPGISLIISDLNMFIAELPPEMVAETGLNVVIEVDVNVVPLPITLSIYHNSEIVHKLPGKFLPDGLPYVEKGYLLGETDAAEATDPNFGKCWMIANAPILTIGETYTVIYNGVPYDCVCQAAPDGLVDDPAAVALGNFSVVGGANTGEPFAMLIITSYQMIMNLDLTGATSVRIGIRGEVVHKMDDKFLPDDVARAFTVKAVTGGPTDDAGCWEVSVDKTFEEIRTHAKDGNTIVRILMVDDEGDSTILPLQFCYDDVATFSMTAITEFKQRTTQTIWVKPDDTALLYFGEGTV